MPNTSGVLENIQQVIAESIKQLRECLAEPLKLINEHFVELGKIVVAGLKRYEVAEEKSIVVLEKYKWLISPSLPINIIYNLMEISLKTGRQDSAVNNLFIKYFSANNWQNLQSMVVGWNGLIGRDRMKILMDCVYILQNINDKKINQTNVILPTLIAQIDGILTDYLINKEIMWRVEYDDRGKLVGRKSQFKKYKIVILPDKFDDIAETVFLDILLQPSQKGKKLEKPFNFNRHKIMHGENKKYGRKNYLIRAFLVLDFLANLK